MADEQDPAPPEQESAATDPATEPEQAQQSAPEADTEDAGTPMAETPAPEAAAQEAPEAEAEPEAEPEVLLAEDAATEAPAAEDATEAPAADDATEAPTGEDATAAPAGEDATAAPGARDEEEPEDEAPPREKPAVPGAHLEVDIVPEGVDPLGRGEGYGERYTEDAYAVDPYASEEDAAAEAEQPEEEPERGLPEPISTAAIDLASGARYRATGKRKSAIARVTLRPGSGTYLVNGRTLEEHFPRLTLQRNIRQPLETVGYEDRMDVVARLHGGGVSAQAGALRHGVSRALLEADPNLRGELKRRGFLTRDSRAKERKTAGLKKARKRPQFSKR